MASRLCVRALVRSQFADGTIEAVTAEIAGETDEQVLIMGHLCHPAPMANDNASGAAAVMEAARALNALIAAGQLPRPRRGIRFLWVPEMTGTYAYLAGHEHELARFVAGLNLDMVGEDQDQTGSSWLLVRTSDALPSFAAPLLEAIREGYFGEAHSFSGQGDFPMFRHAVVPYSNGSDHYILGDPSVGIAAPLLIQWPDRFYHTTADTLEKVSPQSLQRATAAGRHLRLFCGQRRAARGRLAGARAELSLRGASGAQAPERHHGGGGVGCARGAAWERRVAFRLDRQEAALESLRKLDPDFDPAPWRAAARTIAEGAWARARDVLERWQVAEVETLADADGRLVPTRRYRGPVSLRPHLRRLPAEEREAAQAMLRAHGEFCDLPADVALYWADGKRTLAEILDLTELETGVRDAVGLLEYVRLLARLELLDLA